MQHHSSVTSLSLQLKAFVGFIKALQYIQTVVQIKLLTKLKVGIARADVVEGAHESLKNQSYSHGIVDTKELGNSMTLK